MKITQQLKQLEMKMNQLKAQRQRRAKTGRSIQSTRRQQLHGGDVAPVKLYDSEPARGLLPEGVPFQWAVSKASCSMHDYKAKQQHPNLSLKQPSKILFTSGHIDITSPAYQARGHLVSEFDNAHAPFASSLRFAKASTRRPTQGRSEYTSMKN